MNYGRPDWSDYCRMSGTSGRESANRARWRTSRRDESRLKERERGRETVREREGWSAVNNGKSLLAWRSISCRPSSPRAPILSPARPSRRCVLLLRAAVACTREITHARCNRQSLGLGATGRAGHVRQGLFEVPRYRWNYPENWRSLRLTALIPAAQKRVALWHVRDKQIPNFKDNRGHNALWSLLPARLPWDFDK